MTDRELAGRLAEAMCAAQHRYRAGLSVAAALTTPRVPDRLIDELAVSLAPLLRTLAEEAMEQVLADTATDAGVARLR